jgi:hypothetical protein
VLARLLDVLSASSRCLDPLRLGEIGGPEKWHSLFTDLASTSYGPSRWPRFLNLSANLFRINNGGLPKTPVQTFYQTVESMAETSAPGEVSEVLAGCERPGQSPKQLVVRICRTQN